MDDNENYLANLPKDTLHINPTKKGDGAYVSFLQEGEELLGILEVSSQVILQVSTFFIKNKEDYSTFKLKKIKKNANSDWKVDAEFTLNDFNLTMMEKFLSIIKNLKLNNIYNASINLGDVTLENLKNILETENGRKAIKQLTTDPNLKEDIFALTHKKNELVKFGKLLNNFDSYKNEYVSEHYLESDKEEPIWQNFFERNPWIFGHGLCYQFLHKVSSKLETTTTGYSYNSSGKRIDAFMKTKALISQYVLIEIKKPTTSLLASKPYRPGSWPVSQELTGAISQVQKSVFDFTVNQNLKDQVKDESGNYTGEEIYRPSRHKPPIFPRQLKLA